MSKNDEMAVNSLPEALKKVALGLGFKKQCSLKKLRRTRDSDAFWVKVSWGFSALMTLVGMSAFGFTDTGNAIVFAAFMLMWAACGVGFALLMGRRLRHANELEKYIEEHAR